MHFSFCCRHSQVEIFNLRILTHFSRYLPSDYKPIKSVETIFQASGDIRSIISRFLINQEVPIHQISGVSWDTDALGVKNVEEGIYIESKIKYADIVFDIPLHYGKW
jgi:hypothetical protein